MSLNYAAYVKKHGEDPKGKAWTGINTGEGLTKQSFLKAANINTMVARWRKTGTHENVNQVMAKFGDVSELPDYQSSLNNVLEADKMFLKLPSAVRTRFSNNPAELIDFVKNEDNREEAIKLGLIPDPKKIKKSTPSASETPPKDGVSSAPAGETTEAKPTAQ